MYTEKFGHLQESAAPGTVALTSTGVATPAKAVMSQCNVVRLCAVITTTVTTTSTCSVQFIYRPTYGSASNAVTLGTLTFPTGQAAGTCLYKDITSASQLLPGGQIVFNVSAASSSAGSAIFGVEVVDSPANAKAISQMTASA